MKAGDTVGPYRVLAKLGEGGMGEVYRARDAKLNRDVAIKVLPDLFARDLDRLARFAREAQTLAALNHPHIAQIYGIEGNALVMELVDGDDLSAIIARGPIPIADVLAVAAQIADALEAAHEQRIVHRDLKPGNIKVRMDGAVKVLDFGLAAGAGSAVAPALANSPTFTSPPMMTQPGVILGTAAYMAPEQARGKPVDRRADIWAFGCVLFEMVSGARPFDGDNVTDLLAAVVTREPDWTRLPDTTPGVLRGLIARCLEKDARKRLRDIGEARVVLEQPLERGDQPFVARAARPDRAAPRLGRVAVVV